jgi:hypothetical protein
MEPPTMPRLLRGVLGGIVYHDFPTPDLPPADDARVPAKDDLMEPASRHRGLKLSLVAALCVVAASLLIF